MFFADPVAAFANLARATVPGGRLAVVAWQPYFAATSGCRCRGRHSRSAPAPADPRRTPPGCSAWPTPDRIAAHFDDAGWSDVQLDDEQVPYDYGAEPAIAAAPRAVRCGVLRTLLDDLDDAQAARAMDALHRGDVRARHARGRGARLPGLGACTAVR